MMWMICLFGGLGAMARYVLDVSIQRGWNRENRRTNRNFPLSTLVINGVASLCAGIAMMSYYSQSVDMDTVMMFVVGFLGGFSTFSTALNEVVSLIRQRRFTLALGYGIATERHRHQGRQSGCNAGDCIRPDQAAAEGLRLRRSRH